ncbi:MAG TPA: adenylate/guanylate cyclase domain-containing protein [Actinomycetota bacterium]
MAADRSLSAADLARDAGTSEDRIRRFVELGILEPEDDVFRPPDIQRVRVTEALDRAGTPPEHVGRVIARGDYTFRWVDSLFEEPASLTHRTIEEAAHDLDIPMSLAERMYTVWSLAAPGQGDRLRRDDVEMLEIVAEAHHALGGDEERTIAAIRYFGENVRRIAESQIRWFRARLEEPRLAAGVRQPAYAPETTATAAKLLPLARRAVDVGYLRHLDHYLLEDVIENIEIALERAGLAPAGPRTPPGIAFVDLSDYTSLTEREGDVSAAGIADRFTEVVRRTTIGAGGRVVKFLGDGAMLHFPDAGDAVRGSLDLVARIPEAGLPAAHAGVNAGPVVFRDGDYYGRAVNVAARVASRAAAGDVLVAEDAVPARVPDDLRFELLERASLKGVAVPVTLYRAHLER